MTMINGTDNNIKIEEGVPATTADGGGNGPVPPVDDVAPSEPPVKPEWTPGKAGFITRRLMKIAGVDMHLARTMPVDEQQQMKRVGIAIVFGALFLAIAFGTALAVGFEFQWWTIPVALVLAGIMWALDTKFVGAHWAVQGLAFCRSRGLIPNGGWQDQWKRVIPIVVRWTFSAFIAFVLTDFVLLKLFEPDIVRHWEEQHRAQNRPIVETVTAHQDALMAELAARTAAEDQKIEALGREKQRLSETGTASTADIDQQIAAHLDRIKKLKADKDGALQERSVQRQDGVAEKYGFRLRDGNTGRPGEGTYFNYHSDMAKEYETTAKTIAADIDTETKAITELRRQRAAMVEISSAPARARLDLIEQRSVEESANRAALAADYRRLQNDREEWIAARVREAPGYVPMPQGILAKLEALASIIAGSALIASLVFSTKGLIMLLESAGPLAKVAFTAPGIYQMLVALRLHDAAEMEGDRRLKWDHWRVVARSRNHAAIDAFNAQRQRQATESRARDALHKMMAKAPWMH